MSSQKSQSLQKYYNKNPTARSSAGREDPLSQQQGARYYQSRYIYMQSPAESVQTLQTPFQKRSGQISAQQQNSQQSQIHTIRNQIVPQSQQFEKNDQISLQTPVQNQYIHSRQRSDYNYKAPNAEMEKQMSQIGQQSQYQQLKNDFSKLQLELERKNQCLSELQHRLTDSEQIIHQQSLQIQQLSNKNEMISQFKPEGNNYENLKMQAYAAESKFRLSNEEKQKFQENFEIILKQKEAEKCLEANDLIAALNHFREEKTQQNIKHKQLIAAIQNKLKNLSLQKQALAQQLYSQKNQWQSLFSGTISKMSDKIKATGVWFHRVLKDRDATIAKLRREKEKEVSDLNQRWQDVVEQQEKTLNNDFQNELLSSNGKLEQRIVALQGQVNEYKANYMPIREHSELMQHKETIWNQEHQKLESLFGEVENQAVDLEWKLRINEKQFDEQNTQLINELRKKYQLEVDLNACEKQRIELSQRVKCGEETKQQLLQNIEELVDKLNSQIEKNDKDLEIKKQLEEQLLIRAQEIENLSEEILQRKFQIEQNNNLIIKRDAEIEQKNKDIVQKKQEIEELQREIAKQEKRIRLMEVKERNDLAEYFINCKANSQEIESLWRAKKELWRALEQNEKEHLKGYESLSNQKKKVVQDLFGVTWQLRQRDNELKNEQRTVQALSADKKKLNQIVEDLNGKIEQLDDKIEELTLELKKTKDEKNKIIQKFQQFKLSQLKQQKFQLVQAKKLLSDLQKEYMSFNFSMQSEIKQSNAQLQTFVLSVAGKLEDLNTQYEEEMNKQRVQLEEQYDQDLNTQLENEKERSRVQLDTVKSQTGRQIVKLNEQLKILKKKLSSTGLNNNQLDQELFQSQNVMKFADQEIFDIRQRYKNIQIELDSLFVDFKGKYETVEQDHLNTVYSKQQSQQLKHFTDIQNYFSLLLTLLKDLLAKYEKLDEQKDKDLKNSQALFQSKFNANSRFMQSQSPKKYQQEPANQQLYESFSPTQQQQLQQDQQIAEERDQNKYPKFGNQQIENF